MKITYQLLILIGLTLACNSPKKLLDDGNYQKAFEKSLNTLQKDKGTRDDKTVLIKAFNEMVKEIYQNKEDLGNSQDVADAEKVYEEISQLRENYNRGSRWLKTDYESKMDVLSNEQEELRISIAESYWSFAQEDIAAYELTQRKAAAQSAYGNLRKVSNYQGDYPDLEKITDLMYDSAIINVAILAQERFGSWNEWEIDREFQDLANRDRGWYRFDYKPINSLNDFDCVMEIELYDLDVDNYERRNVENFSKEVEDGYTTKVDTSGNTVKIPKYKTVTGSASIVTITTVVEWSAAVQWSSRNGDCEYYSQRFNEQEDEACQIIQTSGDERAIPNQYLNQYSNVNCNFEDELREEVLEDLADEIAREYF